MTDAAQLRQRYLAQSVMSATPARLLVMLYDRLALDLGRAEKAQLSGDRAVASEQLLHAQDIVSELMATLDVDAWEGAPGLLALYTFLHGELVRANTSMSAEKTRACLAIVEPLREAWTAAAEPAPLAGGVATVA